MTPLKFAKTVPTRTTESYLVEWLEARGFEGVSLAQQADVVISEFVLIVTKRPYVSFKLHVDHDMMECIYRVAGCSPKLVAKYILSQFLDYVKTQELYVEEPEEMKVN